MVLPVVLFYILFSYVPMVGIQIAFKDFKPMLGMWASPLTDNHGFAHFIDFFTNPFFGRILKNTMLISILSILFSFPMPVILALVLNEIRYKKLKRVVQTVSYMPHFISLVVVCGMVRQFCLSDGLFNQLLELAGIHCSNSWLQMPEAFRTIYIGSDIWQSVGWNSIIYLAAIAGVDSQLYEAAEIDGAGRWKKCDDAGRTSGRSEGIRRFYRGSGRRAVRILQSWLHYERAGAVPGKRISGYGGNQGVSGGQLMPLLRLRGTASRYPGISRMEERKERVTVR